MPITPEDPRIADIVKAGKIRLALFLPQYADAPDGGITTIGAGVVAQKLMTELATRLGIEFEIVRQPTPHGAVDNLNAGAFEAIILGINAERVKLIDFTPPVFQFDFAYMLPLGSAITDVAQIDQPGVKIAVPVGHASWMELQKIIKNAEIIGGELPDVSFEMVKDGSADVFALPREQLLDYAAQFPGAVILEEGFGYNDLGLGIAKGRADLCSFIGEFTEEAKASGLVQQILDEAELTSRGFSVAP